jgi:hypothetical protein
MIEDRDYFLSDRSRESGIKIKQIGRKLLQELIKKRGKIQTKE